MTCFGGDPILSGAWVRGAQNVGWSSSDQGSGMRSERLRIDGAQLSVNDYGGQCDLGWSQASGEFARVFQPCPTGGPWGHGYALNTASVPDGSHTLQVCAQDYSQAAGLDGSGGESCDQRTIHTDNTPPGKPAALAIRSANPARYLDHFGTTFSLPPDAGSPIARVHYLIRNAKGEVVVPEQVIGATNPTEIADIQGPKTPGAYHLKLWLEDSVGFQGPAAEVAVPHDTTPPAAPQELHVGGQTSHWRDKVDLGWQDIADDGSPIAAAHYRFLDASGTPVGATQTLSATNPEAIHGLSTPAQRGHYKVRVWLEDEEGNAGAPATAPLSYQCARSPVGGGASLDAGLSDGTVHQSQGATLKGALRQSSGAPVAGAPLCVFEQVEGEDAHHYVGLAYTDAAGNYRYAVAAGPNRTLRAVYRPGNRSLSAQADLKTQVKPTLTARKSVIHNGQVVHLEGQIPGPRNDDVVIVLQVRQGKGWLAFRRYRTRGGGRYEAAYPFHRTIRPTDYEFRAQVRESGGYPCLEGDSDPISLKVLPKAKHRRCAKGRHLVKRHGKARCALPRASAARRCARARRAVHRRPTAKGLRRRAHRLCGQARHRRHGRHLHGGRG